MSAFIVKPYKLSDHALSELKRVLDGKYNEEKFCDVIERRIEFYLATREASRDTPPNDIVRSQLQTIKRLSNQLLSEYELLPDFTKGTIRLGFYGVKPNKKTATHAELDNIFTGISELGKACDWIREDIKPHKTGRRKKGGRIFLARTIADAYKSHMNKRPSSSPNGLFDNILAIVLQEVDEYINDRKELIREATSSLN